MQGYYPIFTLLILLISCERKQETKYYFKEYDTEGWLIPVRIGEETYNFVFDTGSSSSSIEQELAQKLKLQIIDSTLVYTERNKKLAYHDLTEKLTFSIANTPMSISFYTDSCNIIGMDIINKYHWMFDRSSRAFQLQEKTISIEKRPSDIVYKRKYRFSDIDIQVPIVDLLINDTISIPLLFDSGDARTNSYQDDESNITMFPVVSLKYYEDLNDNGFFRYVYDTYGHDAVLHYISPRFFLWLDSITIDNLPPSSFYMPTDVDNIYRVTQKHGYIGALTWHFIRQFRTFYIDPEKQEFTFIVSPEDSSIIRKSNIEEVAILKKKRKIKFVD